MYKKRLILAFMTLGLVFAIIFGLAMLAQLQGRALLHVGLGYATVNFIVMLFAILSMGNVIYEMHRI